jgi:predicted transposase YdaD
MIEELFIEDLFEYELKRAIDKLKYRRDGKNKMNINERVNNAKEDYWYAIRNIQIYKEFMENKKRISEIAEDNKISSERVRQIVLKLKRREARLKGEKND